MNVRCVFSFQVKIEMILQCKDVELKILAIHKFVKIEKIAETNYFQKIIHNFVQLMLNESYKLVLIKSHLATVDFFQ